MPSPPGTRLTATPRPTPTLVRATSTRVTHTRTAPRVPLGIVMQRHAFVAGDWLLLRVNTAPRARVSVSLRVPAVKTTCTRRQHRRRCTMRHIVMYSLVLRGTANAHGTFIRRAKISYEPVRSVVADLTVAARLAAASSTRLIRITIMPPSRRHTPQAASAQSSDLSRWDYVRHGRRFGVHQ